MSAGVFVLVEIGGALEDAARASPPTPVPVIAAPRRAASSASVDVALAGLVRPAPTMMRRSWGAVIDGAGLRGRSLPP